MTAMLLPPRASAQLGELPADVGKASSQLTGLSSPLGWRTRGWGQALSGTGESNA